MLNIFPSERKLYNLQIKKLQKCRITTATTFHTVKSMITSKLLILHISEYNEYTFVFRLHFFGEIENTTKMLRKVMAHLF